MTHDPLCQKANVMEIRFGNVCSQCDLIAKVREETFAAAMQRVEAQSPAIRRSNDDGMGGAINDQAISRPETFTEYLSKAVLIAAIKGDHA